MKLIDNRKNIGILVIAFGIALIGLIVYFIFFYDFSGSQQEDLNNTEVAERQNLPQNISTPVKSQDTAATTDETPQISAQSLVQEDVRQLSSSFTERLGSWSNQADSNNLSDLKLFMTSSMQDWADDNIIASRLQLDNYDVYYGITTKAVTAEVLEYQDEYAEVMVSTKRTETEDNRTKVFNQDILIKLRRVGSAWKVDGAYWQ